MFIFLLLFNSIQLVQIKGEEEEEKKGKTKTKIGSVRSHSANSGGTALSFDGVFFDSFLFFSSSFFFFLMERATKKTKKSGHSLR
jgi:hypothetical protein